MLVEEWDFRLYHKNFLVLTLTSNTNTYSKTGRHISAFMELSCSKCEQLHERPVGRRCIKVSMATNITSSQANAAVSAVLFSNTTERPPSPISSTHSGTSQTVNVPNTQLANGVPDPLAKPSRTEELTLSELQKLSACMSNMEQEVHTDTVTSTPRKRKKSKGRSRKGENSVIRGNIDLTDTQTTFDDSVVHTSHHSRLAIPVHTQHSTSTTSVTTTSLFSQRNPIAVQQNRVPFTHAETQVVFSTCHSLHPGQHIASGAEGVTVVRSSVA